MSSNAKFYAVDGGGLVKFAPCYTVSRDNVSLIRSFGFEVVPEDNQFRHSVRSIVTDKFLRGAYFPGVLRPERPARGALNCPAPAGITNHSTLTMNDGFSGDVVFEFVKSGSPSPGNVEVDISTAVAAADVAAILAAVINNWTTSLSLPTYGGGPGFGARAEDDSATVRIVQASPRKNFPGQHVQPYRGTWFLKTMGSFGNNAITPSVAGEWTGRIAGMTGGKQRKPGLYARPATGARAQAIGSYVPVIPTPPPPDLG